MSILLARELAGIVRPGVFWIDNAIVVEHEHRLDAPLAAVESIFRLKTETTADDSHDGGAPAGGGFHLQVEDVRRMYKRVGLDPTKRRPSSEALLRRVRKGDPLPRINSMVDVCNWCSLEFQLPYGLYDTARIDGEIVLRLGREGESYPGIRKDDVHVGHRITLADSLGPFGNPTSDSARTMVTTATPHALVVIYAPHELDIARLRHALEVTAARMHEFTSGTSRALSIVEGRDEQGRAEGQI